MMKKNAVLAVGVLVLGLAGCGQGAGSAVVWNRQIISTTPAIAQRRTTAPRPGKTPACTTTSGRCGGVRTPGPS